MSANSGIYSSTYAYTALAAGVVGPLLVAVLNRVLIPKQHRNPVDPRSEEEMADDQMREDIADLRERVAVLEDRVNQLRGIVDALHAATPPRRRSPRVDRPK